MFTVDTSDISAVKEVVDKVIKRGDLPPLIPYEFTQQGMMERLGAYISYQDFCRGSKLTGTGLLSRCYCGHSSNITCTDIVVSVTASSEQPDHPAGHAVDDEPNGVTCYHSNMSPHSWWEADIGSEQFIREIIVQLKVLYISIPEAMCCFTGTRCQ